MKNMKNSKKLILMSFLTILISISFLIPITRAVEWTYDGIDTESIPNFSVFPSEMLVYNYTGPGDNPELLGVFEIVKGNITDLGSGIGTCVWGNGAQLNITTGEITNTLPNALFSYWNETVGYNSLAVAVAIPVEDNGKVSLPILNNVSVYLAPLLAPYEFEHQQVYPSINSFAFWNTSTSNAFTKLNYTDDGILTHWDSYGFAFGNYTLVSQPAQLPPDFSFTTESGNLSVNSTDFKLNITISDADNNNDGLDDTNYEYRIQNGSTWSVWTAPTNQLDWDLGSVASGNYDITMEVKNMYGVASDYITIEYTAPGGDGDGDGAGGIPSYPIAIFSLVAILGISLLILRQKKKLRF